MNNEEENKKIEDNNDLPIIIENNTMENSIVAIELDGKDKLKEKSIDYKIFIKRSIFVVIAITMMGFAQAIFNFTSPIGMAPIGSATKSLEEANPWGIVYTQFNYVVVTILVIIAIFLSPKEKKLITSTSFITGFALSYLVAFFTENVVSQFPGFTLGDNGEALLENPNIYTSFDYRVWLWFLLGFFMLTLSIGIWANVDFVLRPYDAVILRAAEREKGRDYVFVRNLSDSILVIIAIGFSTLGFLVNAHPEKDGYVEYLTVGIGTILFVTCAGYLSHFWIKIFKKIV